MHRALSLRAMASTAGIAVIGDEILSGKYADENASFLIGELRELGVALRRVVVLPDEVGDIAATVRGMAERFDHVFTSGGVGPTHDDKTMEGIARGFGVEVAVLPELVEMLEKFYGAPPTGAQLRIAEAPVGAAIIYGEDPSSPVVQFRNVTILPGVPSLFRRKFLSIRESFRQAPIRCARLFLRGDEASIADRLGAVVAAHPAVAVGSYPRFDETRYRLIVTVESADVAAVAAALAELRELFAEVLVEIDPGDVS